MVSQMGMRRAMMMDSTMDMMMADLMDEMMAQSWADQRVMMMV